MANSKDKNFSKDTPLCKLAEKYGTDKCAKIKHPYTEFYFKLLSKKRKNVKKVLELGIGYPEVMQHIKNYKVGASLFMWRDFFPNAMIYGVDIVPKALLNTGRIQSFLCDQTDKNDLSKLIKTIGKDIDLIIDDGSHKTNDQIFTCQNLLPLVDKNVIYIIEDVAQPQIVTNALKIFSCWVPSIKRKFRDDNLVVVRNKDVALIDLS